jgi:hypothetical protein
VISVGFGRIPDTFADICADKAFDTLPEPWVVRTSQSGRIGKKQDVSDGQLRRLVRWRGAAIAQVGVGSSDAAISTSTAFRPSRRTKRRDA